MKRVALVGARGYVGQALQELVKQHDGVELEVVTRDDGVKTKADAWVLALPNGTSASWVEDIEKSQRDAVIVDLSADHRFDDAWVYGQPERLRDRIRGAKRISNPGCYATAMQLA